MYGLERKDDLEDETPRQSFNDFIEERGMSYAEHNQHAYDPIFLKAFEEVYGE